MTFRLTADPSALIGSSPRGAVKRVSLAVRDSFKKVNLSGDDTLVLACSGGADSMALSIAAADLAQRQGITCYALTVNHGIREGSAREAARVAATLASWGVNSRAVHFPGLGEGSLGPEGQARLLRRRAFTALGRELGSRGYRRVFFLLGHTLDDQAETVLLRLARGSGVSSLRAMAPVSVEEWGTILRPLLGLRRADTHTMCQTLGLEVVDDPTNALDSPWRCRDGSALRRSALRHNGLPQLSAALGLDPIPALARTAALAADDDEALEYYTNQALKECLIDTEESDAAMDVNALEALPVAVRRRVIRRVSLRCGARAGALTERHLNSVNALVDDWKGQRAVHLPGVQIVRKGKVIYVFRA